MYNVSKKTLIMHKDMRFFFQFITNNPAAFVITTTKLISLSAVYSRRLHAQPGYRRVG